MDRFGFNEIGSYVLCVAIATMIAALLVSQLQKSKKAAAVTVGVGILCFLLGCIVPYAVLELSGYSVISDNVFIINTGDPEEPADTGGIKPDEPLPAESAPEEQ